MVHIADTRVGSRYGEQFIRKIQKFIEMEKTVKGIEFEKNYRADRGVLKSIEFDIKLKKGQ